MKCDAMKNNNQLISRVVKSSATGLSYYLSLGHSVIILVALLCTFSITLVSLLIITFVYFRSINVLLIL